jgi:hypothetical protein
MKITKIFFLTFLIILTGAVNLYSELIPAVGKKGVPLDATLKMVFNEPVRAGEKGTVTIVDYNSEEPFTIIDIHSNNIEFNGNVVTLKIDKNFDKTDYYVLITEQAIRDIAGNYYKGISSNDVWYFSTLDEKPEFSIDGLNLASETGRVNINWEAKNQADIVGYELFRTNVSEAGVSDFILVDSYELNDDFKAITSDKEYIKTDNSPDLISGFTYTYKLVSIDKNGNRNIESVEDVEVMNTSDISISDISPNPVSEQFSFDITMNESQSITIEILNGSGRLVDVPFQNITYPAGTTQITVPVNKTQISAGSYILKVSNENNVQLKKFIISK